MHATPWSLDEFAAFDVFATSSVAPAGTPAPRAMTPDALDAEMDARFAAEAARIEADAYARGRADGERAARATLDSMLANAMQALDDAVQSVQLHESRWIGNAEENVAALAVIVARHIVQREIDLEPTLVASLVQQAIEQYPVDQEISVRLHPEDLAACRGAITQDAGAARTVRWIADPSVMRGGCLAEGRERIIDGRVDTALERAYRNLAGVQAS
ncbi:MAG: flagellar assembly protein FliH [Gemmatimonadaceae bacterium]|nr:flagellar assembly protein FliH [Gemmatimonadaceae bacterium]